MMKNTNTVKIYSIYIYDAPMMSSTGGKLSLVPWGSNTLYYKGDDDGGKDYIIPDGYTVEETQMGEKHFYNSKGRYCRLIDYNDRPALLDADSQSQYPLTLKTVKDAE